MRPGLFALDCVALAFIWSFVKQEPLPDVDKQLQDAHAIADKYSGVESRAEQDAKGMPCSVGTTAADRLLTAEGEHKYSH